MIKGLSISVLAGAVMFCSMDTARATELEYVHTNISTNEGVVRFDWEVKNGSLQHYTLDAITNMTFGENFEWKQMHSVTNYSLFPGTWEYHSNTKSSFDVGSSGSFPVIPGSGRTFSASINETNLLEIVSVPCWGYSANGKTDEHQIQIPVSIFPHKILMDGTNVVWYSPINNLGKQFIIDSKNDLTQTNWTGIATNTHSETSSRYEYPLDTTNSNGFFRVRETE